MILISRSAARAIFAEVQRWVELGLEQASSAYESLVYPLSALFPGGPMLTPVELAGAEHLRAVVIDDVAVPPDAIKSFSPANCHFSAADLHAANCEFNEAIDRQLAERPRLGVHSKLHSHPFGGGDFLSGGDLQYGVLSGEAVAWRHSKGLSTAILHVAYPDAPPRAARRPWRIDAAGALCASEGGRIRWRVRTWASSARGDEMTDLGDAEVVPDSHALVRAARRPPYWRQPAGSRWCDAQKAALREAGYAVSRNLLGRGWRRYLITAGGRQLLIALPPDLPAAPPRVLEVQNALQNEFAPLPLPDAARADRLGQLSLLQIVKHFGGPAS
jgi:hypothetical protein